MNFCKGIICTKVKDIRDWHAGHLFEDKIFLFLKLNRDNFYFAVNFPENYDFVNFIKTHTSEKLKMKISVDYGHYELIDGVIFLSSIFDSSDTAYSQLFIISEELLKDKEGKEYHFIPVDDPEFENLPL